MQTGKYQESSVNITGPGPTSTHWIKAETLRAGYRGKALVHTQTGDILGHVEPYRGGGVNMVKGYWATVYNPMRSGPYGAVAIRVKSLDEGATFIKKHRGIYNEDHRL
tara:strand:+ start:6432 stop:6755 length:324 start_codon:yes stop_codon:yes gene_type:complete